ncbi:MAG: hypothetical protein ACXAC5_01810 [Promethearchaeota archaeon]|jgi:hypothetical protein
MVMTKQEIKEELDSVRASLERHGYNMKVLDLHVDSDINEALEAGRITVEHRGHYGNGRYDLTGRLKDHVGMPKCSLSDARKVKAALKRHGRLRSFVTIIDKSCLMSCPVCDEHLGLETNAKVLRPTTECKYPDGMVTEFELNVPSGKIVCKDDLRSWFDYHGDFNINSSMGTMLATLEMAKIGCAHGFVGNSCPGIYRQANDIYIIANGAYTDEEWSDENYVAPEGKHVAGICTDLWWYSLVDYDEFKRRARKLTPKKVGAEVFKVKPGVYRFRQMREDLTNEEVKGQPYIYAEFKWVRKPDRVKDYATEAKARNFTIGQVVHRSMRNYPDLYANSLKGVKGCIDHIFCVLGGGGDWHENGFIQYDPSMPVNEPETEIPKFDKPERWYGLYKGSSAVTVAAGMKDDLGLKYIPYLNPSFLAVAFDLARNIYLFGVNNGRDDETKQRELALQCLQGLAERYPDDVPEDCKILIMPVIDQANWVLELLQVPVRFYWHTTKGRKKVLRVKNRYNERQVHLDKTDIHGRTRFISPGKFMSYGHAQTREAITWSHLIAQFTLWIKGYPREATDAPNIPGTMRAGKLFEDICNYLEPKDGFMERLSQTSYGVNIIVREGEKELLKEEEKKLAANRPKRSD